MKIHASNSNSETSSRKRKQRIARLLVGIAILLGFATATARASDPIGVFALVDKVTIQPTPENPQTIQIWGVFCLAKKETRNEYHPPKRGYLYYALPGDKPEAARKEWNDLRQIAGTGAIIGFASRYKPIGTVHLADAPPKKPLPYPVGFGMVRADARSSEYPPVKALRDLATANQPPATHRKQSR